MNVNSDALQQAPIVAPETHHEFTQEEAIYLRLTLQEIADMGKPRDEWHAYDLYILVAGIVKVALDKVPA